ncbi:FAD:protein FMN transferase [Anaerocolumna sedimenticola]|uniref:FAD:protein FMN transferase n=1 Tax=Anaerocolumna sedimenticola TaxID=2696063 RepID=A0A6P1TN71_9FIRM|nr:FAD:protein FMN transferase [Anaerocolumna sedimenticola]QHQ61622.1 FAD:protein FMN transferase [Anaerocolumna sedimenticola]
MLKRIYAIGLGMIILILFTACSNEWKEAEKQAFKMDTIMDIKAYGPKANKAIDAAFQRIDEIEKMASASIETSDISMINNASGKEYVKVHPEIINMIKTSIKYSELSEGAFDITVGPLIKLWGIGTENQKVPTDDEIKKVLPLVDYKNISIKESDNSIKLLKEGMSVDLGGIAKGYAADEAVRILKEYGVKSAIINLGGSSVYALGEKQDKSLWAIAVQHPRKDDNKNYTCIIRMPEQALSTSGDYERYFIKDGKRYHHILNPFTGYPADAKVMSDTIVISSDIPNCNMLADILTKVTFVSGMEKGFKIINGIQGVECIAVTTDYKIYKSSGWKEEMEDISPEFTLTN